MAERDDRPDGPKDDIDTAAGSDLSACRNAERIARDERNMHAVLSALADQLSESLPAVVYGHATPARRRSSWRKWTVGPLAAAAVVAALILVRSDAVEEGSGLPPPPQRSMVSEMDVEADRPFVVFPTNDPDIAVVWLLSPEESD